MSEMYHYVNPRTNQQAPLLSQEVYEVIKENAAFLDSHIIYTRDFNYDYFGFKNSFIEKAKKFIVGNFTNQGEQKKMDAELEKSFAGFVSKLANYDDENKKQFDGFESALKHEFITQKIGYKKIRSDTSFDI